MMGKSPIPIVGSNVRPHFGLTYSRNPVPA
jgi:hypothetical protein